MGEKLSSEQANLMLQLHRCLFETLLWVPQMQSCDRGAPETRKCWGWPFQLPSFTEAKAPNNACSKRKATTAAAAEPAATATAATAAGNKTSTQTNSSSESKQATTPYGESLPVSDLTIACLLVSSLLLVIACRVFAQELWFWVFYSSRVVFLNLEALTRSLFGEIMGCVCLLIGWSPWSILHPWEHSTELQVWSSTTCWTQERPWQATQAKAPAKRPHVPSSWSLPGELERCFLLK